MLRGPMRCMCINMTLMANSFRNNPRRSVHKWVRPDYGKRHLVAAVNHLVWEVWDKSIWKSRWSVRYWYKGGAMRPYLQPFLTLPLLYITYLWGSLFSWFQAICMPPHHLVWLWREQPHSITSHRDCLFGNCFTEHSALANSGQLPQSTFGTEVGSSVGRVITVIGRKRPTPQKAVTSTEYHPFVDGTKLRKHALVYAGTPNPFPSYN